MNASSSINLSTNSCHHIFSNGKAPVHTHKKQQQPIIPLFALTKGQRSKGQTSKSLAWLIRPLSIRLMKPNSHVIKWMTFRYMTYWHSYWLNNRVFFCCSIKLGYSLLHNLTLAKIQTVVWMLIGLCPFCVHRVFITYTLALMSLHSILRLKPDSFFVSSWSCSRKKKVSDLATRLLCPPFLSQ